VRVMPERQRALRLRMLLTGAAILSSSAALMAGPPAGAADNDGVPSAPAPPVLAPIDVSAGTGVAPSAVGVQRQLGRLVQRGLGHSASVLVVDPASGTVLLDQASGRPRIPASTTKLATAAAALTVLGPQTRLPTTVYRKDDTIFLVGGGDPTLVRAHGGDPLAGGSPSLAEAARSAVTGFVAQTRVTVVYDDSAFRGPKLGPGWPAAFPAAGVVAPVTALVVDGGRVRPTATSRVADPARQAATVFAGFLRSQGLDVRSIIPGRLEPSAVEIARVESAPVADIVERMLTDSENNYAEALAHLTGGALLQNPTFAGGSEATTQTLRTLGVDVAGLALSDGSGLSPRNRVPARLLGTILTDVATGAVPQLAVISSGLAVAGLTGTLADRFDTPPTSAGRGFVRAKTGTLTGVVSLAGTVLDDDGRILVFAMIANDVSSLTRTRDTMDLIASRLAACGCQ
jgi:serine-type D-Ala-D-Ala carboxypeptidase/endopeptidase (penicillin-binding protein 4)